MIDTEPSPRAGQLQCADLVGLAAGADTRLRSEVRQWYQAITTGDATKIDE